MTSWWVFNAYDVGGPTYLASWVFWVILSISLHELAHGWAALWQGDDTPRTTGHMTINPLVHMGGYSLLIFAFIGIAWGLMPTDPSKYRYGRRGRIFVAGAGPAMNLLISFVTLTGCAVWIAFVPSTLGIYDNISLFLLIGGQLNLVLAVLNLIPVPPLDGSSILAGCSWWFYQRFMDPRVQQWSFFIVLGLFFLTPLGGMLFSGTRIVANTYLSLLLHLFGGSSIPGSDP